VSGPFAVVGYRSALPVESGKRGVAVFVDAILDASTTT